MPNPIEQLCLAPSDQAEVLQGNLAFAVGCVRAGIHCADGYPGTPSSEVIDRGLSQVQNLIHVGWSVNEAVAAAVGHGHTLAGRDCVVTMKIPGLFQAADVFTSGSAFVQERGALIYYIASDFTPSSTQHVIDPRYLFKSCFVPVFEPRNHQELHEAAGIAVDIGRRYKTPVVIMPGGTLCHSEGLIHLMAAQRRDPIEMPKDLRAFNVLPGMARKNYNVVMAERLPALIDLVEHSPLNHWDKGAGKIGVIVYGVCDMLVREVQAAKHLNLDILSLAFTNPLPMNLLRDFCASIDGPIYVFEDGYRYVQEALQQIGVQASGKEPFSSLTEWTPALIAEQLGSRKTKPLHDLAPVMRPPVICAGCPYRLFANEVALMKKRGQIEAIFGDIGCNTLLYYMNALDTALAMGASEGERIGYVVSRPDKVGKVISVIGDGTECHSGLDATRNAIYRNVPGVKVILDNEWAGMTGGQPSPTSPENLAGEHMKFDLPASLTAHGAKVIVIGAYEKKDIRQTLKTALSEAEQGVYTTIVLRDGACIQKSAASQQRVYVNADACKQCNICLVCPGLELNADGIPTVNNLCSGCGGHTPACVQMCPTGVLQTVRLSDLDQGPRVDVPSAPRTIDLPNLNGQPRPDRLSLAIRGVGGQGNLFFGRVLTQLAFLAGYDEQNIIKGETHGMAQMGGPVISTFACGDVTSPVLLPGSADCLIVMEQSEVLRPGFLEMLKHGGTILMANTQLIPPGLSEKDYPTAEQIKSILKSYHVIEVDVLGKALELGDHTGRSANVVMMGVLSTCAPFDVFPPEVWHKALQRINAKPEVWDINYAAFNLGREFASVAAIG